MCYMELAPQSEPFDANSGILRRPEVDGELIRLMGIAFEWRWGRSAPPLPMTILFVRHSLTTLLRLRKPETGTPSVYVRLPSGGQRS
jgi:hypothetical protein